MKKRAIVVGAGWSGLACALTLADAGVDVCVLDAAPQVGGRARRVDVTLGDRSFPLDNGQHLLIGAYRATQQLMQRVGVAPAAAFVRTPFALPYADGVCIEGARLPAPLHLAVALLRARGLALSERWAMALWVQRRKREGWRAAAADCAYDLLRGQPSILIERVWQPLCVAALNVRLEQASASIFLNVLRDSLAADAGASEFCLPRRDLSALFPDAAAATLAALGAEIHLRGPVHALAAATRGARWQARTRDQTHAADAIVLALPPDRAAALLATAATAALAPTIDDLSRVAFAPIATVYLRYPSHTRLPRPFYALHEAPERQQFGQWVFDRGATDARCAGVLSVVVSADGRHLALDRADLIAAVDRQIGATFRLPASIANALLVEKRATIVPAPGLTRPATRLPQPGLYLAGDAADSPYPSTIEGSVRTGIAAAHALCDDLKHL